MAWDVVTKMTKPGSPGSHDKSEGPGLSNQHGKTERDVLEGGLEGPQTI